MRALRLLFRLRLLWRLLRTRCAGALALELVAFFFPVVRVVAVAVALPEARLVCGSELEAGQPLRALPEVLRRDEEPCRPSVVRCERRAVRLVHDERALVLDRG